MVNLHKSVTPKNMARQITLAKRERADRAWLAQVGGTGRIVYSRTSKSL